jgi:hypothetical protein
MLVVTLALALAAQALPTGTVIAGVSTHDGTRTDVTAFLPDGSARVLFAETHAPGFVPRGALVNAHLALALQHDGADGATVVVHDLASGARVVAGERAIAKQAPRVIGDAVTWVRAAETPARSTFDVVRASLGADSAGTGEEILASIEGAWLTPLTADQYLHVTVDGAHRIVARRGTSLDLVRELGKGPLRRPALASADVIIERAIGNGRAQLVRIRSGGLLREEVVREGIAGMDPIVVDGTPAAHSVIVAGAGTKRAALVVLDASKRERIIDVGRAGVATPLTASMIDGALLIVARVDRGRALPPETWIVDGRGAPRALAVGGAVEVYGVVARGTR